MIRVEVRNEFGLGAPELYKKEAASGDDPKALLEGVAVSGLVGILRQLGDLAEFAAEVFHGLQEQVTITSSRSHKLMSRAQRIEASLPSLEKAVLAQKSHLHFAYTAGSYWHPRIRVEKNHFIYNDLPRFIMDSYEDCRGPPRLDLLDKFDPGGPGSCLKRYSDPTFFKRTSNGNEASAEKIKVKKSRKIKKKRSWRKHEEVSRAASSGYSGRMYFAPINADGKTSPSRSVSACDATLKPDQAEWTNSFHSRSGSDFVVHPSYSTQPEEQDSKESSSASAKHDNGSHNYSFFGDNGGVLYDSNILPQHCGKERFTNDVPDGSPEEETGPASSGAKWEEWEESVGSGQQECDQDEIVETSTIFGAESIDRFEALAPEAVHQPADEENCYDEKREAISKKFETDFYDKEATNFETVFHHKDLHRDDGNMHPPASGDAQPVDNESETDNYMDALNIIESESETDVDNPAKSKLESYSNLNKNEIDGIRFLHSDLHGSDFNIYDENRSSSRKEMLGDDTNKRESESYLTAQCNPKEVMPRNGSDCVSLECPNNKKGETESHLVGNCNSNEATSTNGTNSISLESPIYSQSSQMASGYLNSVSQPDIDPCASDMEFVGKNSSVSKSMEHFSGGCASDKFTSSPSEPQNSLPESLSVTSIQFWTNGGLLGLEPSKPPDFGVVNAVAPVSAVTLNKTTDVAPKIGIYGYDQHANDSNAAQQRPQSVQDTSTSNCSSSYEDDEGGFTRWRTSRRLPSADLDVRHQKLPGSLYQSYNSISDNNDSRTCTVAPGDVENDGKSLSRMFDIGNKLLRNGFHRQLSFDKDGKSNSGSSLDDVIYEQNFHKSVPDRTFSGRFKDFSRSGSPYLSPSSSPPLGHMKISFQPLDGVENSQLKLKFPNGNNSHESCNDMFPSFQLVPEPAIPLPGIDSDSDEDTFCRSSPSMSDDCLSCQSESNSELWESGESPAKKDHELYDSLRRISLTESVSTSQGTSGTTPGDIQNNYEQQTSFVENGVGHSQSAHAFYLPSLDNLNPSFKPEVRNNSNDKSLLKSFSLEEPNPTPPPLPPMQWRATKEHLYAAEDRQHDMSESLNYAYDLKVSESTISQHPKPAPLGQDQIVEAIGTLKNKQPTGQGPSLQKETNQLAYGNRTDGKEDFLHQIRTKSFNLRPTVTTRPTVQTGLSNGVKVTAILEKANAIRQAVGSDDGDEDDNWSDN